MKQVKSTENEASRASAVVSGTYGQRLLQLAAISVYALENGLHLHRVIIGQDSESAKSETVQLRVDGLESAVDARLEGSPLLSILGGQPEEPLAKRAEVLAVILAQQRHANLM